MASSPQHDSHLHSLLSAVTDAILDERADIDRLTARYAIPRAEIESFIRVIERLHIALVRVRPSRRFAQQLRLELLEIPQSSVLQRVRFLPPRVQIAAGVAVLAGVMLLSRRRLRLDEEAAPEVQTVS